MGHSGRQHRLTNIDIWDAPATPARRPGASFGLIAAVFGWLDLVGEPVPSWDADWALGGRRRAPRATHTPAFVFPGAYATAMILAYHGGTDPSARTASSGVGVRLSGKRTAITAPNNAQRDAAAAAGTTAFASKRQSGCDDR